MVDFDRNILYADLLSQASGVFAYHLTASLPAKFVCLLVQ